MLTAPKHKPHRPVHARPDDGNAFLQDPLEMGAEHATPADDDAACSLAEHLAEEYVESATSNDDIDEIWNDEGPRPDLEVPLQALRGETDLDEPADDFSVEPEDPYQRESHEPARRRPSGDGHHSRRSSGV